MRTPSSTSLLPLLPLPLLLGLGVWLGVWLGEVRGTVRLSNPAHCHYNGEGPRATHCLTHSLSHCLTHSLSLSHSLSY